ncbi:hypothetical protein BDV96DRAFT_17286 [Lophiotrema nucula]|uniref:RING-type domain-containing protein n=1 Tax=Lophiotrema nucula TaxID=690887 RepID=A0A6A5ZBW7_9PLEO|nr:hypothetical protein BDV96DRAFT_17286 [Lophiotrema nucula]
MTPSALPSRAEFLGAVVLHPVTPGDELCPICWDPLISSSSPDLRLNKVVRLRPCGHSYHTRCIATAWFLDLRYNTCPLCRCELFALNKQDNPDGRPEEPDDYWYPGRRSHSGRLEQPTYGRLIERSPDHRIIRIGSLGDTRHLDTGPDRPRASYEHNNRSQWKHRVAIYYRSLEGVEIRWTVTHKPYTTAFKLVDAGARYAQFVFRYPSDLRPPEDYFRPSWFREHLDIPPADDFFEPKLFE